ncbi:MAG: deoxyribodipyrimidine photo-lyase [Paludibacter sp.]|nr:deoxyribodipyrimidine photo-lyase [Paludibacter sp.]
MMKINSAVVVFWFRRDLRLEDNAGLYHALQSGCKVLPLFIFDTNILSQLDDKSDRRVDFIHQALTALNRQLEALGSSLIVRTGKPLDIFKQLVIDLDVKAVYCNRDYEPYALERDQAIRNLLEKKQIEFKSFKDQVIFEADEIKKSNGEPYTVFTPFSRIWKQKLTTESYSPYPSEKSLDQLIHIDKQKITELEELGYHTTGFTYSPPALDKNVISNYDKTRDFPALDGSTRLSVHIRFGTVSIRKLVSLATELNETWLNELIWREFFMSILFHFPGVEKHSFRKHYENIAWRNNEQDFERWCEGKTGYPMVDAGMRQLNETGWMHNRVRMVTASFLTKHLLIDWRWGEAYFAGKLMDYDLAANNGNWQWAAGCGCDAAPYFRIFNPMEQAKRFDPELKYIRRWVKELDTFEYPQPVVEHTFARQRALETYKAGINER